MAFLNLPGAGVTSLCYYTCLSTVFCCFSLFGPHTAKPVVCVYIFRGESWRVLIEFCLLVVYPFCVDFKNYVLLYSCLVLHFQGCAGSGDGLVLLCTTIVLFPGYFMCSMAKSGPKIPNSDLEFKNRFEKCRMEFVLLCCMCHSQS